jgi:hypothetical protein
MAKFADDNIMDAGFTAMKSAVVREAVCSSQPATYSAIAAARLAEATLTSADMVIADGTTSGRKVTVAAKSGVSITASGTATHVVLHDNSSKIWLVTTVASQALTSGGTVDIGSWSDEIADPS